MTKHQTLASRPSLVVGVLGCILLTIWTGEAPRLEDVRACSAALLQRAKSLGRCGMVVAVHPTMPLPEEPIRAAIQAEVRKLDPYLVCGATVISRDGLAGTAMRAVTSTLQLLSRPRHPEKIVASGAEAARFLHGELTRHLGSAPSADDITAAYDEITMQAWSAGGRARG
jgi:hypothetical protein